MVGFERILGASRKPLWSDSSPYVSPQQTTDKLWLTCGEAGRSRQPSRSIPPTSQTPFHALR